MDKRHFTVVIGSKEHGLYISSKPSSAAKKAVSKLCASNKSKKVEFCLREITQGSKKKTYGPYLGEMKKLKKPIELKGRVIRHEIKVHLKNGKSSTIKTAKKMRGGEENEPTIPLNRNTLSFLTFVRRSFPTNNSKIKEDLIKRIENLPSFRGKKSHQPYIFYIFRTDPRPTKIISAGIISGSHTVSNMSNISRQGVVAKYYLFIRCLLSRERGNRGGTSAIYHILDRLPEVYSGICLNSTRGSLEYYTKLGFIVDPTREALILNKTPEIMENLKGIIERRGPITTEFHSTYPNNIIT